MTSRVAALARKVRRTSPAELWWRGSHVVAVLTDEVRHTLNLDRGPDAFVATLPERELRFGLAARSSADLQLVVDRLRRECGSYVDEVVAAADDAAAHRIAFFGRRFEFGRRLPWNADPESGAEWPRRFHSRIEIFEGDTGFGDVKYVWELNRHQFLPALGKAYRLTGDRRYASAAVDLIATWIEDNPFQVGINWTSALEVAIRSLAWCATLALMDDAEALTAGKRRDILRSLNQHARFIERHLSFYFSPYNHLVGEAAALAVIGAAVPALPRAASWRDRGWQILSDELPRQLYADGGTVEQATGYHHFTLGFYLQAILARRSLGLEVPAAPWTLCERMFEFSLALTRPDGCLPMIGDSDEGRSLDLQQAALFDFRPFLAIGAVLFGRPDFKRVAGAFPPDAAWLLGADGWSQYDSLPAAEPEPVSVALPHSGYYVMRSDWGPAAHYLAFDAGEIADGVRQDEVPSAAHGHADALSIEVAAFGTPMIVDPGFLTYNGALPWHRYFRETEAHNTVVVDERSQAQYAGRLKWSFGPRVQRLDWFSNEVWDVASGFHTGYARLKGSVTHRRTVVFAKPDYWLVRDELLGEGEHTIDCYFHLAPLDVTSNPSDGSVHVTSPTGGLTILPIERDALEVEIRRQGETPEAGWIATGYDRRVAAPIARLRTRAQLPLVLHTLLLPRKNAAQTQDVRVHHPTPHASAFDVVLATGKDHWLSNADGQQLVNGGWRTDARLTCVRLNEGEQVVAAGILDGSFVAGAGGDILRLQNKVDVASAMTDGGRALVEASEPAEVLSPAGAWAAVPPAARCLTRPGIRP